ncbi:uncharacterized protein METZ01_LOCUS1523 [marine metagenome]|uniref:Uncharacterized protein n=1 Tax=marine metagenome TaxID=408172 RepID=A0A381N2H8_9ZZZZ
MIQIDVAAGAATRDTESLTVGRAFASLLSEQKFLCQEPSIMSESV